jgi:murein DD-endopeptidase MepM/ murein hydrolase activator NlpD
VAYTLIQDQWTDQNGCIWNEPCVISPLGGATLEMGLDFNFKGKEKLIYHDLILGIGESPVYAALSGIVADTGTEESGLKFINIYSGNNLSTRYGGIKILSGAIAKDSMVHRGMVLGKMPPKDGSPLFLQIMRDGRFLRFNKLPHYTTIQDNPKISTLDNKL